MHKVADWASFHSTDLTVFQDVVQAYRAFALPGCPVDWVGEGGTRASPCPCGPQDAAFADRVVPALCAALDPVGELALDRRLREVAFRRPHPEADEPPHTIDRGPDQPPVIVMGWQGRAEDIVCLAHETAHAAQLLLSQTGPMPPVARETCAFLGELCLLTHARRHDPALFATLLDVWRDENRRYLGGDLEDMAQALKDPGATYQYRLNYPVARLVAVHLHHRRQQGALSRLFAGGSQAMDLVPLAQMAARADAIPNYLPPFPEPQSPAQGAYQSLGAMALLDIDTLAGVAERDIAGYYEEVLSHLRRQTAFIALREDQKPIGYATWRQGEGGGTTVLTRQTAPFGDHLKVQRTLRQRLGETVGASHSRSARSEQVAW